MKIRMLYVSTVSWNTGPIFNAPLEDDNGDENVGF